LQGTLENFFAKRPAVEVDAEDTDVNSCGDGDSIGLPTGSASSTSVVLQPSSDAGIDDFDVGLSKQKYDMPVQPMLGTFPKGRNGVFQLQCTVVMNDWNTPLRKMQYTAFAAATLPRML